MVTLKHRKTLAELIAGREVELEDAIAAFKALGSVDATLIRTARDTVRLRVSSIPRAAFDVRIEPS